MNYAKCCKGKSVYCLVRQISCPVFNWLSEEGAKVRWRYRVGVYS